MALAADAAIAGVNIKGGNMANSVTIRRGDAFSLTVELSDDAGAALAIDPANLVAQIYDMSGNMVEELTIAAGSESGEYVLSTTADTSNWPEVLTTNIYDINDKASSTEITICTVKQISREIVP
ncbi:MAG TPA: hypothetical protein PLR50_00330 [Candidatus Rifleibacterium sp.]|nr:hypothetical protein [Candidatus Rifleibacterium sp.]